MIGVGSNIGDRRQNLRKALEQLQRFGTLEAVSSVYESDPIGFTDQPRFWNLVASLNTRLSAHDLFAGLKAAGTAIGREPSIRYGPRSIDLDLLLLDTQQIAEPNLQVPHPRMLRRRFVLEPILEIDPALADPASGTPLTAFVAESEPPVLDRLFPGISLLEPADQVPGAPGGSASRAPGGVK